MRRWLAPTIVIVGVLALAGCTNGSASTEDGLGAPAPITEPGKGTDGDTGIATDEAAGSATTDREIISQGWLSITVPDPIESADDAVRIVERAGGRIDSRQEQPPVDGSEASAQLVVRIPSARLTATLDDLKELGEVEELSISSTDVTSQSQDLNARIKALRASVDRLLTLLSTATTTTDLIAIESALSQRQSDLESLESQERALSEQVDLATISVYLGSEATAPIDKPDDFWSGIVAGWEALVGFVGAALIALGVALPWLAVAVVMTGVVLLIVRLIIRRATPPPPQSPTSTTMEQ